MCPTIEWERGRERDPPLAHESSSGCPPRRNPSVPRHQWGWRLVQRRLRPGFTTYLCCQVCPVSPLPEPRHNEGVTGVAMVCRYMQINTWYVTHFVPGSDTFGPGPHRYAVRNSWLQKVYNFSWGFTQSKINASVPQPVPHHQLSDGNLFARDDYGILLTCLPQINQGD